MKCNLNWRERRKRNSSCRGETRKCRCRSAKRDGALTRIQFCHRRSSGRETRKGVRKLPEVLAEPELLLASRKLSLARAVSCTENFRRRHNRRNCAFKRWPLVEKPCARNLINWITCAAHTTLHSHRQTAVRSYSPSRLV